MMKKLNVLYVSAVIAIVIFAGVAIWAANTWLEWEKPEITVSAPVEAIGQQKTIEIKVTDEKCGIRSISAAITQDNRKIPLLSESFPERGTREKVASWTVNTRDLKLHDGEAVLEISASDHSLLDNTAVWSRTVRIDTSPPVVSLLSMAHNINPGGTCLAVYRLSKEPAQTGVIVESEFFQGYPVMIDGKTCYLSYFAIPEDVRPTTRIYVTAEDRGGNRASSSIPFYIRNVKKFRSDTVKVSDQFLIQKMPEFQQREPVLAGKTPLETFVHVNEKMRYENQATITSICRKTDVKQLWSDTFIRMKNAAPMALFGDKRTYRYGNDPIGHSVHLGVDLASTSHAAVEASNSGEVIFTGYLGIYGNTVIIDHGQGISSLYAHMDTITAGMGQKVAKGESIGTTGATGFAGGDHLHFGIQVSGKCVNPVEWWDPHWIKDNVTSKLEIKVP
ncbi:MAG: M23 family metallopeptidase [Syntrophales bacterium]